MVTEKGGQTQTVLLKQELMLQINQALFEKGTISQEVFELAKIKILKKNT